MTCFHDSSTKKNSVPETQEAHWCAICTGQVHLLLGILYVNETSSGQQKTATRAMYIAAASCSCTVLGVFYVACTIRYLRCCQVEVPRMLRGTRAPLGLFTFFFLFSSSFFFQSLEARQKHRGRVFSTR